MAIYRCELHTRIFKTTWEYAQHFRNQHRRPKASRHFKHFKLCRRCGKRINKQGFWVHLELTHGITRSPEKSLVPHTLLARRERHRQYKRTHPDARQPQVTTLQTAIETWHTGAYRRGYRAGLIDGYQGALRIIQKKFRS